MTTYEHPGYGHLEQPDRAIAELARKQFGTFARWQAHEVGLSRHQIAYRLGVGRWETIHPGVFRITGTTESRPHRALAGLLYAGRHAWFSHITAARLHGFEPHQWNHQTWLTVPVNVQRPPRPGLMIIRSRRISGFTTAAYDQPVLSIERTIVDLAGVLDRPAYQRVLYDVFSRNLVTVDGVLGAAEDFGGKTGVALVHQAITEFDPEFESGLEHEADQLFQSVGLVFSRQVEIQEDGILLARLDFAAEEIKLGVEVDGARYHSSPSARAYDRDRDRALVRRGWQIERFTTEDIRKNKAATLRHLLAIYNRRISETRRSS